MGVKELSAHLKENGQHIVDSVCTGTYLPQAILGVEIPVEGQVNRLKLIKRQAYGRASFDLLCKRVLVKI